jgi:hypothetical protein
MKLRLDILVDMAFHLALYEWQSRAISFRAASLPEKPSLALLSVTSMHPSALLSF